MASSVRWVGSWLKQGHHLKLLPFEDSVFPIFMIAIALITTCFIFAKFMFNTAI